jgi:hypothetical protein
MTKYRVVKEKVRRPMRFFVEEWRKDGFFMKPRWIHIYSAGDLEEAKRYIEFKRDPEVVHEE